MELLVFPSSANFCAPIFGVEGKSFYLAPLVGRNVKAERMYNEPYTLDIGIYNLRGQLIGSMSGEFKVQYETGFFYFDIPPEAKQQGLSRDFVRLFLRKFPDVEQFADLLQKDNLVSYKYWADRGWPPENAVARTPYGRVMTSMGFKVNEATVLLSGEVMVKMVRENQLVH